MAERPQPLALARVTELALPSRKTDRRTSASSSSSCAMERLEEELGLEMKPQRLQRQYTLNVVPTSSERASISRSAFLDATPDALEDVLTRWEKNQIKWRRVTSKYHNENENGTFNDTATMLEKGGDLFRNVHRRETFEVKFGEGFLGLEFGIDTMKNHVVIQSARMESRTLVTLEIPIGMTLKKGLAVEAVNGENVTDLSLDEVLTKLQLSKRPMTVTFRRASKSVVVCKLCENKVNANSLDEHINYCVLSKRVELEADVINDSLVKLTAWIDASLEADSSITLEKMQTYHALRVVAIQASVCDVTSVDSFALCARLVKIIDRIRQQAEQTAHFKMEEVKYCIKLRNLIHAKMSKMRASHKVMFQQTPVEIERVPLKRTKSLENLEMSESLRSRRRASLKPVSYRISIRDFQIVKPISKGAFGKVYLARKKTTGDQYAIKVVAKEHLLRKKQIEQIETERNILASVVSPFVVKLFWTFQTKRNLFLVMEYLPGGDFMSLLECIVQLEEQVACVYIAEIAIALNHLHRKGCVHRYVRRKNLSPITIHLKCTSCRDLKPDNILLSSTGHIKLTDFGLSEEAVAIGDTNSEPDEDSVALTEPGALVKDAWAGFEAHPPRRLSGSRGTPCKKSAYHTYGRCGTPDYLAPEIILGAPHGPPVDYWALGIILYEMMVGFPPFNDDSVDAIFENILERQILWPDGEKCLSLEAVDLIDQLLDPNPATRMNWERIQSHPFFEGMNWDTILDSVPPFVPTLEGPTDTSYFNNRNLTDIFIDDDEFEMHSRSGGSSEHQVDAGPESDAPSTGLSATSCMGSIVARGETSTISWGAANGLGTFDAMAQDQRSAWIQPEDTNHSHCRFPSGMYGSRIDLQHADAFSSFSFINMKALAAASQAEANLIMDRQQETDGMEAGRSIVI
ncbi:hypothetical protein PsorP6_018445 [Peronosclerospora sorghi]|nr:hypothetical protein PsorP6_018445 [Peronosclerospora sorghi]